MTTHFSNNHFNSQANLEFLKQRQLKQQQQQQKMDSKRNNQQISLDSMYFNAELMKFVKNLISSFDEDCKK